MIERGSSSRNPRNEKLPGAEAEVCLAAAALGGSDLCIGPAATRGVRLVGPGKFLCGRNRLRRDKFLRRAGGGWIRLPSGLNFTVQAICWVRLWLARLCVPTACGRVLYLRALARRGRAHRQRILLAGYPEAVGTLWEVESTQIERFLLASTHGPSTERMVRPRRAPHRTGTQAQIP